MLVGNGGGPLPRSFHLNQCVPWYELMRYHRALRDVVPAEVQHQLFNEETLAQLSGKMGRLPESARTAAGLA